MKNSNSKNVRSSFNPFAAIQFAFQRKCLVCRTIICFSPHACTLSNLSSHKNTKSAALKGFLIYSIDTRYVNYRNRTFSTRISMQKKKSDEIFPDESLVFYSVHSLSAGDEVESLLRAHTHEELPEVSFVCNRIMYGRYCDLLR